MRALIFATVAVLGVATAGTAIAERAHVRSGELAANGQPQPQTDIHGTQFAAGGGWHPSAETDRRSGQVYAAVGQAGTSRHGLQLAQGWHPQSETNRRSTNA